MLIPWNRQRDFSRNRSKKHLPLPRGERGCILSPEICETLKKELIKTILISNLIPNNYFYHKLYFSSSKFKTEANKLIPCQKRLGQTNL